jgi:hypothetical protein
MRQVILSPEFQLYSPFFVATLLIIILLFLILLVGVAFWVVRAREVKNEVQCKELLENLFNQTNEGGSTMGQQLDGKTMFEKALSGAIPAGASGNQAKQVNVMASCFQAMSRQSHGLVQKVRQLTLIQAASEEMASGQQMVDTVDSHIQDAQGQFQASAPLYEASALGNEAPAAPAELTSSNTAPAPAPAPQAEGVPNDSEILSLLRKKGCVTSIIAGSGVNPETFTLGDLPDNVFEKMVTIFKDKCSKTVGTTKVATPEDQAIYDFLLRHKAQRNG